MYRTQERHEARGRPMTSQNPGPNQRPVSPCGPGPIGASSQKGKKGHLHSPKREALQVRKPQKKHLVSSLPVVATAYPRWFTRTRYLWRAYAVLAPCYLKFSCRPTQSFPLGYDGDLTIQIETASCCDISAQSCDVKLSSTATIRQMLQNPPVPLSKHGGPTMSKATSN